MLVPNDIYNRIDDIIERSYTGFIYQILGKDFLTLEQRHQVEALGLLVGRKPLLELLYLLVKQRSEERYQTDTTLQELLEDIFSSGIFDFLPQKEQAIIDNASQSLDNIITKVKSQVKTVVKAEILNLNKEEQEFEQTLVTPLPIPQKQKREEKQINKMMVAIGAALLIANKTFHKDFTGELTDFVNKTVATSASEKAKDLGKLPGEALVYKKVMHDRCNWCGDAYTNSDGSPIIYKLKDLVKNGSNLGKPKSQWLPVVGPHHYRCRCQLQNFQNNEEIT